MSSTPTLQALAIEARDTFGEDGTPGTTHRPASFDLVVEVYAREGTRASVAEIDQRACSALTKAYTSDGEVATERRDAVQPFVSKTLEYLHAQYPEPQTVTEDQQILSTLFWGHLVEARYVGSRSR